MPLRRLLPFLLLLTQAACAALPASPLHEAGRGVSAVAAPPAGGEVPRRAVPWRANDDDLVVVTLSGGGMRAATFGAEVLFEIERLGLLPRVDAVSAVSGGAIAGALFGLSCTAPDCPPRSGGRARPPWEPGAVFALLAEDMEQRLLDEFFEGAQVFAYWKGRLTRSDVMAERLDAVFFDGAVVADLNPRRPTILINASNFTDVAPAASALESVPFAFAAEDFAAIGVDLAGYPLSYAVMASSAFPGVFNLVPIRNYRRRIGGEATYVHLSDGGTSDNTGLLAVERLLRDLRREGRRPRRIIIVEADASLGLEGVPALIEDPRDRLDYVVDVSQGNRTANSLMLIAQERLERSVDRLGRELAGDGYRRVPLRLRAVADRDLALWYDVKTVATRYSISPSQLCRVRAAALTVSREMLTGGLCAEMPGLCTPVPDAAFTC